MKTFMLSTAVLAFVALPFHAQTATSGPSGAVTSGETEGRQATVPMHMQGDMQVSADAMIGKRIYIHREDPQADPNVDVITGFAEAPDTWEDIGEVRDVFIAADGKLVSVIMEFGGFLGLSEHKTTLPMAELKFLPHADGEGNYFVVYTGSRARLEGADAYDRSAMENQSYQAADLGQKNAGAAAVADPVSIAQNNAMVRPERDSLTRREIGTLTAENLTGARVYGANNNWVGEVSALVLAEGGKISHAVVDVGGWLGIGEHPVALSLDQVDIRSNDGMTGDIIVYVDLTEDHLKAMPAWKK